MVIKISKIGIITILLCSAHSLEIVQNPQNNQQNVTNLILNPQDIVKGTKNTQSLSTIKTFKSISDFRQKFSSRKSVFDQAKSDILNEIDDRKQTKDKSFLALEEQSDSSIEIATESTTEHIFSSFTKGIHLFHFGSQYHKSDKQKVNAKKINSFGVGKKNSEQAGMPVTIPSKKPVISLTTVQRPPEAGQLVGQQADIKLDIKDDLQQKIILESLRDSLYLGTIHIGSPNSQPIKVAFDTGSEFLAITSSLCSDATTPARFKFKKFNAESNSLVDSKNETSRCLNQGFDIDKSSTAKISSNRAQKVNYGSAELDGFIFEDYTCIQSMDGSKLTKKELSNSALMQQKLKDNKCTPFEFLTLYEAKGLAEEFHGILGLSPKKNEALQKQHFLWALREYGLIDRAMVSFSITQNDMKEPPYALFGGYNSSQIVGGPQGLKVFKNYASEFKSWALLGQAMLYDGKYFTDISHQGYSALIDTGSSQLTVPPPVFKQMQAKWQEDVPNIQCKPSHTFCHVLESCTSVVQKLKPIAFQLSDYIFQLNPEEYLQEARADACFFVIHKTDINETEAANIYLIGDLFLKHFYSVYDFDQDEVSLGINTHSQGKVQMFSPQELSNKK